MATEYSDLAAADYRPSNLSSVSGRYQTIAAVCTTTAATVTGGIFVVKRVPKGTKIFPTRGELISSAAIAATSCTANVGTTTDDDILATAININAAGTVATDLIAPYTTTVEEDIIITLTIVGAVTAGVTITVLLDVIYP